MYLGQLIEDGVAAATCTRQARPISHWSPYRRPRRRGERRSLRTFPGVSLRRSRPIKHPRHQITNQSHHFPPHHPPIKRPSGPQRHRIPSRARRRGRVGTHGRRVLRARGAAHGDDRRRARGRGRVRRAATESRGVRPEERGAAAGDGVVARGAGADGGGVGGAEAVHRAGPSVRPSRSPSTTTTRSATSSHLVE
jgi:hypothetical protein